MSATVREMQLLLQQQDNATSSRQVALAFMMALTMALNDQWHEHTTLSDKLVMPM